MNSKFKWTLTLLMMTVMANVLASSRYLPKGGFKQKYETDGHYWTVLLVATMLKLPDPKLMAYAAEYPDNVINADGYCVRARHTFMYPKAQKKIHALTGGSPELERKISLKMILDAVGANELGIAAHHLGDSFAHLNDKKGKMYPHLIGHTLHWKEPDKIKNNPSKYLRYVNDLVHALGGQDAAADMTVFEYIARTGLNSTANAAIMKAEYNLLIHSLAFSVEKDQLAAVEKYLNERLTAQTTTYTVHTNTDGKWRVTTTVILRQSGYIANLNGKSGPSETYDKDLHKE